MQKSRKFKILNAKITDERFLFNIYNENVTQKKFYTNRKVNYANHQVWMKKQLKERSTYIIYLKKRIGYIRFSQIKFKNFEISIAINSKYKRMGIAKLALLKTTKKKKFKGANIIANVKKSNLSSKKFFINCGFKKISNTNKYILKNA